jgi:cytochrome c2
MDVSRLNKSCRWAVWCALAALSVPALQGAANAQQGNLAEGEQLYTSQCKICHGSVSPAQTSDAVPPHWQLVRLAMQHDGGHTRTDASPAMTAAAQTAPASRAALPGADATRREQLAFAPPFGPHLRGVYGRSAGSVEGFEYSSTFMKTLKGMEWNEAALDVWITNTQAWVPGVYMFYKQPDPEVRRKIIEYLKANSPQ